MTGSGEFSVGVEEEYQLVHPETGELRSRARDVLATDWAAELYAEIQETMLEVGTRVCGSVAELDGEIRRLRLHVGSVAAAQDLAFVAAGLHPFSSWRGQEPTAGDRYERVRERFGRVMRTEHVFGMHVHVAVPESVDRVALLGTLRRFLPHLLALSTSSPIFEGEDTGFASYRAVLVRRLPHSGIPPRLRSRAEYLRYVGLLTGADALQDEGTLYWSLRPHPKYPTLEFRVTDVCPRVEDAVAICALVRALVMAAVEGGLPEEDGGLSEAAERGLLDSNEWHAARLGMDAVLVAPERKEGREPVRDSVLRLVERLAPLSESAGDGAALARVAELVERGTAARRMREALSRCGGLPALVRWLAAESQLGVGLDRRREQREGCRGSP